MHDASADPQTRQRISAARSARARAFNDGLAAILGRAPRPDRRR